MSELRRQSSPLAKRFLAGVLFAFFLALGGCAKKGNPADAARRFLEQIAAGDVAAAYSESAFGFQAQQTQTAFAQTVKELGLSQQDTLAWQLPEILADEARIPVEISSKNDRNLQLVVTLVRENGVWRVHSLRSAKGGGSRTENRFTLVGKGAGFSDARNLPMPDEGEISRLVVTTLARFDQAVQARSFTDFYRDVAVAWQKQLTVSQLERAFQPFIKAGVRIGGLKEAELRLDGPPGINSGGVLIVNGHFETAPYQVYFSMKFVYELSRWKLFGLDVNLQH